MQYKTTGREQEVGMDSFVAVSPALGCIDLTVGWWHRLSSGSKWIRSLTEWAGHLLQAQRRTVSRDKPQGVSEQKRNNFSSKEGRKFPFRLKITSSSWWSCPPSLTIVLSRKGISICCLFISLFITVYFALSLLSFSFIFTGNWSSGWIDRCRCGHYRLDTSAHSCVNTLFVHNSA